MAAKGYRKGGIGSNCLVGVRLKVPERRKDNANKTKTAPNTSVPYKERTDSSSYLPVP